MNGMEASKLALLASSIADLEASIRSLAYVIHERNVVFTPDEVKVLLHAGLHIAEVQTKAQDRLKALLDVAEHST